MPVWLDTSLTDFVRGGVSMVLATRDAERVPELVRCWGCLVEGDQLLVRIPVAHAEQTLRNLRATGVVAIACASPIDYEAVQFKGRCLEVSAAVDHDDTALAYRERFFEAVAVNGFDRARAMHMWLDRFFIVRVEIDSVFDQTPGPNAGAPRNPTSPGVT